MQEDFLHYIWQYKKFALVNLFTVQGEPLQILQIGLSTGMSGPDFFNAQIIIGNQKWAGNVEIHVKASDWYVHNHETDSAYDNVILHVVWDYDIPIYRKDNSQIPTLLVKDYVLPETLEKYQILKNQKSWIFCENQLNQISEFTWVNWKEKLYLERLAQKSQPIFKLLDENLNDWDYVFFCTLLKSFGLNANGDSFLSLAQSIPYAVVKKERGDLMNLEALLFGMSNLLNQDFEDSYLNELRSRFDFLCRKYGLMQSVFLKHNFFKLRPDNFPTIRLSQFAQLYHKEPNLFDALMHASSLQEINRYFEITASAYWDKHYTTERLSSRKVKKISKSFVELIVVNTILPVKHVYLLRQGLNDEDFFFSILQQIVPESNGIVAKFKEAGVQVNTIMDSQALIQLKTKYCELKKCLNCQIGFELLKN